MQETSLHIALKSRYAQEGGRQEALVEGYKIDVLQGDLLIEIQTRHFDAIRPKLLHLLDRHPVRLVYPIAQEKWIIRLPAQGDQPGSQRKSPRRGRWEHVFIELVRIPALIEHPNFSLELLLTREEELRRDDGLGSWRRGRVSIIDRRLLAVLDSRLLVSPQDFLAFLPQNLEGPFTNAELARRLALPVSLARRMTYCLRAMGLIQDAGKRGRAGLYLKSGV
jgi:hypothetical protein